MNKYQEALENLKNWGVETVYDEDGLEISDTCLDDLYPSEFSILQKLVDKETPKKPISKRLYYNCHNGECDKTFIYYCSVCNFDSVTKDYANYCPNCGQKLDWSGEDEL